MFEALLARPHTCGVMVFTDESLVTMDTGREEVTVAAARTVKGEGFEVRLRWDRDVLIARVEGPHDSFDISLAYWKVIADERKRRDAKRLLVIENLQETVEPGLAVDLFEDIVKLGFGGVRVAFVDNVDSHRSIQEYVALLARERNIVAAIFNDENQAMTWLRHGEE